MSDHVIPDPPSQAEMDEYNLAAVQSPDEAVALGEVIYEKRRAHRQALVDAGLRTGMVGGDV